MNPNPLLLLLCYIIAARCIIRSVFKTLLIKKQMLLCITKFSYLFTRSTKYNIYIEFRCLHKERKKERRVCAGFSSSTAGDLVEKQQIMCQRTVFVYIYTSYIYLAFYICVSYLFAYLVTSNVCMYVCIIMSCIDWLLYVVTTIFSSSLPHHHHLRLIRGGCGTNTPTRPRVDGVSLEARIMNNK